MHTLDWPLAGLDVLVPGTSELWASEVQGKPGSLKEQKSSVWSLGIVA